MTNYPGNSAVRCFHAPLNALRKVLCYTYVSFHAATLTLLGTSAAFAEIIYATSFEAPTFTAGALIDGQDVWTSRFGQPIGTVETDAPNRGKQYLRAALSGFPPSPEFVVDEAFQAILNYDAIANHTPRLHLSIAARLDGPVVADDVVNAVFEALPGDISSEGHPFGQFSISADGNLYVYGSRFEDLLVVGGIELGRYYELGLNLDFIKRKTTFLLDGTELARFPFADEIQSTVLAFAEVDALAINDPTLFADYTARFDDYSVSTIGEPASGTLIVVGLLFLSTVACRKRTASY